VLCEYECECECRRIFDNEKDESEVSDCRALGCERGGGGGGGGGGELLWGVIEVGRGGWLLGRSSGTRVEFKVSVVVDGKSTRFKYGAGRSLWSGGVMALGAGLIPGILYIPDDVFEVEAAPTVDVRVVVASVCIEEAEPEMEAESGLARAIEILDCVGGRGGGISRDALRSLPFPWRR
jgi:hypothetical protein